MNQHAPTARLECVRDLIDAARSNKFSILRKLSADGQEVFDVWDHISQLVEHHMIRKKAVNIPGLGIFTFTSSKLDVGHNKYILIQRPVFILSEKLAGTHRLTQSKYHVQGEIPVIQLNFTAISFKMCLDRDLVEASVKEVVNALSRNIEHTRSCEFAFTTLGNLVIANGAAKMRFLPAFVEKMDQTGGLSKLLQTRPDTSSSRFSDKATVLPRIQSNEQQRKSSPKSSDIYIINEENENEDAVVHNSTSEVSNTPLISPQGTPITKKKEALVPTLKVEAKSPTIKQCVLTPPQSPETQPGTPRKVPSIKRNLMLKDPRKESGPKQQSRVFPLVPSKSNTNLLTQLLKAPPKTSTDCKSEETSCSNCVENMSDFCYLCYQREKRNIPIFYTEERKQEEQDDDRLLQTFTLLQDSEALRQDQEMKAKKREVAQSIAAFNLSISELLKAQKEERPLSFNRSYVFCRRPITPPHYIKQEDYKKDLATQVNEKRRKLNKVKRDQENLERVEQLKLAEDLAMQRGQYLKNKRLQSDEYRKALDTQMAYRSSELPVAYSDSDGPIFGTYDLNEDKRVERRKRAQHLYQDQMEMASKRKEHELSLDKMIQKEEEEMLRKTKTELLQETLVRSQLNLQQRKDLENTWALHAMKKKSKEFEEKLWARSPGLLLQEQCDKYKRCVQCTRKPMNIGISNVWAESRYVSGSRLII
ncbi:coiled-coil domain-containing protein 81-like isoform X2 [Hydractinia symbiolongicarpus]|uniref:coiled-coil domain-containing protein 81-like isoform X2 n=1 Tax=Hydractinia symbiolongicarpus TaxID=13093 RepID=UPI00254CF415|nr:coiled-coil domain-containing protein 81-like isoform X2 [Hydractinia symbiolongicarpus]